MKDVLVQLPARHRISAKLRIAMDLHVREGLSVTSACEQAKMSRQAWYAAMQRPGVREELEATKARFITEVEGLRAVYRVQALEAAADLMRNAKSESVRARMIEFLAGHEKKKAEDRPSWKGAGHEPLMYDYGEPPES